MSYEIINVKRASSIIRCEGVSNYTIQLSDLSTNTQIETVTSASIKRIGWSSNGYITIARGATPNTVSTLYGSGEIRLDEWGSSLANGSTGNIVVSIVTGGTVFLEVSKTATYSTDIGLL